MPGAYSTDLRERVDTSKNPFGAAPRCSKFLIFLKGCLRRGASGPDLGNSGVAERSGWLSRRGSGHVDARNACVGWGLRVRSGPERRPVSLCWNRSSHPPGPGVVRGRRTCGASWMGCSISCAPAASGGICHRLRHSRPGRPSMATCVPSCVTGCGRACVTSDLLRRIKPLYCWLRTVFADSIYDRIPVLLACFLLGLTLILVRRIAGTQGFTVIPRRWVVERTFG